MFYEVFVFLLVNNLKGKSTKTVKTERERCRVGNTSKKESTDPFKINATQKYKTRAEETKEICGYATILCLTNGCQTLATT